MKSHPLLLRCQTDVNRKAGPHVRFEEMTAQAVNQRAQTYVISRKAFPDCFRTGDRRSRTMPQVSLDPRSFVK
jgi:hypothetical protein